MLWTKEARLTSAPGRNEIKLQLTLANGEISEFAVLCRDNASFLLDLAEERCLEAPPGSRWPPRTFQQLGNRRACCDRQPSSTRPSRIRTAPEQLPIVDSLAAAGAAREHPVVLVFGIGLSIVLMGIAASFIARLLQRYHWTAYVGLAVILYVAAEMIYRGALEVWPVAAAT